MTTPPVRVERRVGQRFPYLLPLALRHADTSLDGVGFTQDVSSRGLFLFTDIVLVEGDKIELTLRMPSEITLGESMPVRCCGRVLRVDRPAASTPAASVLTKIGVAVRVERYEYLPDAVETSATFDRISTLHSHAEEEQPLAHPWARD